MMIRSTLLVVAIVASPWPLPAQCRCAEVPPKVDYRRDVAPLLAEHCYQCHGPHAADRQAGLRLDDLSAAGEPLPSGAVAIVPAEPAASEIIRRVASTDPQLRMPPPEHGPPLGAAEVRILQAWIADGAPWSRHWSFEPPVKAELPQINHHLWPRNPIDRFIAAGFESQGLVPSPAASRTMLARRAALVLTGLPPTPEQLQTLLDDQSPDAYERYLDRLFASPRYGEQMAAHWLDLARYADTHGFHTDSHRDMWRWRDWVIEAYNSHMPLDQFMVEQIAGDLLPSASLSQQIASGFNRNHMINFENGALAEEYHNLYVIDRVNTTATVFLGLTVACAQCHDHKYDPISQREYYQLYAFFNNVPDQGIDGSRGNAVPYIAAPTSLQQGELQRLAAAIEHAQRVMERRTERAAELVEQWERSHAAARSGSALPAERGPAWRFAFDERGPAESIAVESVSEQPLGTGVGNLLFLPSGKFRGGLLPSPGAAISLSPPVSLKPWEGMALSLWVYPTTDDRMTALSLVDGDRWELGVQRGMPFVDQITAEGKRRTFTGKASIPRSQWSHVVFNFSGDVSPAGEFYVNGEAVETSSENQTAAARPPAEGRQLVISSTEASQSWRGMLDELRGYDKALTAEGIAAQYDSNPIAEILKLPPALRSEQQQQRLANHYLSQFDEPYRQAQQALREASDRREAILREAPTTMVMQELKPARPAHLLVRGDYRQKGPVVERGTPAVLHPWPADASANRLGLAQWLVDPQNPLTPRVIVNRQWMHFFGQPLVPTSDDFGLRGQAPTHPELLDWLAVELIESGWNLQHLQRLMLLSAAFRQTSHATPQRLAGDPVNRYYTRYASRPLSAEQVRDTALAASGLLGDAIGGRSVFPYQPAGLWEAISYDPQEYSAQKYTQSHGADLYRRSLYTFWKRSLPPPSLAAFGAPTRETCTVERSRSVTPQQSLVVWNDPTYVEAARHVAQRLLRQGTRDDDRSRIEQLFVLLLAREATDAEQAIVAELVEAQQMHFEQHRQDALALLASGESEYDPRLDPAQLAAWTIAAQTITMSEEFLTVP